MAGKRFLTGLRAPYLTDLADPLMPLDAANRQWVLSLLVASEHVPPGGATGDVLTKATGADYDTAWQQPSSGGSFSDSGMYFDGGTFSSPQNAVLHGGTF